jgi:2,3-bisphosphoglycerate-independent phosphoglycerate mutase
MATLVVFFDGIGVGRDDPETNPFAAVGARRLAPLAGRAPVDGTLFRPLDATLGVPGLPQSATGQTTLLTGVNAAKVLGAHAVGIPGPTLLPLLERESLFLKLARKGMRPTFANAYTREHLEAKRPRWSATTRMVMASGVPFRMLDAEGRSGAALPHDYTGEWVRRRGWDAEPREARSAAKVLLRILGDNDLVLYEYFLTDLVGHRGRWDDKIVQARRAEDLIDAVLSLADLERDRVVVISDHGNLEEGDHGRHTLNPTPVLAWGRDADALVRRVESMEALTPALVDTVDEQP